MIHLHPGSEKESHRAGVKTHQSGNNESGVLTVAFGLKLIQDNALPEGKPFISHLLCGAGGNFEAGCKGRDLLGQSSSYSWICAIEAQGSF